MAVAAEDQVMAKWGSAQALEVRKPWVFPENKFWGLRNPSGKAGVHKGFPSRHLNDSKFIYILF